MDRSSRWRPMHVKQQLEQARAADEIARIYRAGLDDGWVDGFVVALGPEFFALEILDKAVRLDGFNCLRYADVTECLVPAPHENFIRKALAARDAKRFEAFSVELTSLASLLVTASGVFPLVTIHLEGNETGCFIGKVLAIESGELKLLHITPDAEWEDDPTPYALRGITRVDFGGGYEEALHLAAGQRV